MVLLIDNYDSFSYNLVQLAGGITRDIRVIRNDAMTVEEIREMAPDRIILSPGPGYPKDAGICEDVVRKLGSRIPILGVCLGHQGICEVYGAHIGHARQLMHGKQSRITIDTSCPLFAGLPEAIDVARYHSLAALRMKGETVDEITASAQVMREKGLKVETPFEVMEIVGTGGDEVGTFNISTTAAFVVAAGGVPVAKHGNRSVSSKSGAADVLERLGAKLNLTPEQNLDVLKKANICFMFAQVYHSSMKNVGPVRREMGARTIFNILGPLTNPAAASMQLMGVYKRELVEPLAEVLSNLGVVRGLVVNGNDGLDEATMTGPTHMCEIRYGKFHSYDLNPEELGMTRCSLEDLVGGSPEENAQITRDILAGTLRGPKRDAVVLNAALSLYLGIDGCTIADCVEKANTLIDSGEALQKLEAFVAATQEV